MKIAWVPARGSSKRIPRKNLQLINGKTLVELSIEAALDSEIFDAVFVDTDDAEIERIGLSAGAKSLGLRSKELSSDLSSSSESLLSWTFRFDPTKKRDFDLFVLQPTSPLRNGDHIREFDAQWDSSFGSALSVSEPWQPVRDLVTPSQDSWCHTLRDLNLESSRGVCLVDGAIYSCQRSWLMEHKAITLEGESQLIVIPRIAGLDVDDSFQLDLARRLAKSSS